LRRVLPTVDLYDETMSSRQKIHDIRADGDLASEFHTVDLTIAQPMPEPPFGIR
jgi:hypothetical protein